MSYSDSPYLNTSSCKHWDIPACLFFDHRIRPVDISVYAIIDMFNCSHVGQLTVEKMVNHLNLSEAEVMNSINNLLSHGFIMEDLEYIHPYRINVIQSVYPFHEPYDFSILPYFLKDFDRDLKKYEFFYGK